MFFFKGTSSKRPLSLLHFVVGILGKERLLISGACNLGSGACNLGDISHFHSTVVPTGRVLTDTALIKSHFCITSVNQSLLSIHQHLKGLDKRYSGVICLLGLMEPLKYNLDSQFCMEVSLSLIEGQPGRVMRGQ